MRFKTLDSAAEAERAVLNSECDVGLVRGDGNTTMIYLSTSSDSVIEYVLGILGQRFNYDDKYEGRNGRLMKTTVTN